MNELNYCYYRAVPLPYRYVRMYVIPKKILIHWFGTVLYRTGTGTVFMFTITLFIVQSQTIHPIVVSDGRVLVLVQDADSIRYRTVRYRTSKDKSSRMVIIS